MDLASYEINKKFIASLPIKWTPKVIAIEEATNLQTITTEELLKSLITNEHTFEKDLRERSTQEEEGPCSITIDGKYRRL